MKTKNVIYAQLVSYKKSYEKTNDFEGFRAHVSKTILDIEAITPVRPSFSSYLFQMKLDCENMEKGNASHLVFSLMTFLEGLDD